MKNANYYTMMEEELKKISDSGSKKKLAVVPRVPVIAWKFWPIILILLLIFIIRISQVMKNTRNAGMN